MFEINILLVLRPSPPLPHGVKVHHLNNYEGHEGHGYHLNNIKFSTPKDDSYQVWLKSDGACLRRWKWEEEKITDDAQRGATDWDGLSAGHILCDQIRTHRWSYWTLTSKKQATTTTKKHSIGGQFPPPPPHSPAPRWDMYIFRLFCFSCNRAWKKRTNICW